MEPFLAEIRIVSFNFAPRGWAFCEGQIMPINQNQALFSLLGTTYGGNGFNTFALPDLRDRLPMHFGAGYLLGQVVGVPSVNLAVPNLPKHNHYLSASALAGTTDDPSGAYPAVAAAALGNAYSATANASLNAATITPVGGGQNHDNQMPYLGLSYVIALQGVFPSRG